MPSSTIARKAARNRSTRRRRLLAARAPGAARPGEEAVLVGDGEEGAVLLDVGEHARDARAQPRLEGAAVLADAAAAARASPRRAPRAGRRGRRPCPRSGCRRCRPRCARARRCPGGARRGSRARRRRPRPRRGWRCGRGRGPRRDDAGGTRRSSRESLFIQRRGRKGVALLADDAARASCPRRRPTRPRARRARRTASGDVGDLAARRDDVARGERSLGATRRRARAARADPGSAACGRTRATHVVAPRTAAATGRGSRPFGYIDHTTGSSTRAGSSTRTCATPNVATSFAMGSSAQAGPDAGSAMRRHRASLARAADEDDDVLAELRVPLERHRPHVHRGQRGPRVDAHRQDRGPARRERDRRRAAAVLGETHRRLVVDGEPRLAHPSLAGLAAGEIRERRVAAAERAPR